MYWFTHSDVHSYLYRLPLHPLLLYTDQMTYSLQLLTMHILVGRPFYSGHLCGSLQNVCIMFSSRDANEHTFPDVLCDISLPPCLSIDKDIDKDMPK